MSKEDDIVDIYDPIKAMAKISSIVSSVENIKRMVNFFRCPHCSMSSESSGTNTSIAPENISLNYTGLHTDIAFVSTAENGIERTSLEAIEDNILRRNVLESFDDSVADGYLTCENGKYLLTDKGKEHINSPAFIKQFEKDQEYFLANNNYRAMFEFKGEGQDIDIFRYADSFNLNSLNVSENKETVDKVVSYFRTLVKTGFVNINKSLVVTPTEKALKYFTQNPPLNFDVKPVTTKNIKEIVNTVASLAKSPSTVGVIVEVSKNAFKKLQQKQSQNISQANSRH
ncbi:MAG: hypothetical protein UD936_03570 [Acutalibacteraceae bacterium]|nr:hypothetical protein [Acutalibacteraceae bacterium]